MRITVEFVADQIRRARHQLGLDPHPDIDSLAAAIVRLTHSLVVVPGPPHAEDPENLGRFARTTFVPLITS